MIHNFEKFYGGQAILQNLDIETTKEIPSLNLKYEELLSWDWLFGKSLDFTHQMSEYLKLGFFDFHFVIQEANISDVQIFSDSLFPVLIDEMQNFLKDKAYSGQTIEKLFLHLVNLFPELKIELIELASFLKNEIEIR